MTIAILLVGFSKIGCLPKTINLACDGEGIEATMQKHKAQWHDSCRLEYNKTKLQRAEKRKRPVEDVAGTSNKFTHQSLDETSNSTDTYFFCGKLPAGSLCKALTFG